MKAQSPLALTIQLSPTRAVLISRTAKSNVTAAVLRHGLFVDNHRGEHVVHETLDPSLPIDQQQAIRAAGEELTNPKNSLDADFLSMEYEANLLAADSEARDLSLIL